MSLNNEQHAALKSKLDLMKQEIQAELRQHNPDLLRHDSGEGDGAINDVLNHDAMSKYLHQHAEWQSLQRAQARLSENIADICRECGATIPYARLELNLRLNVALNVSLRWRSPTAHREAETAKAHRG